MKIAIYTKARAGEEFPALEYQERICREWAAGKEYEVAAVIRTANYDAQDQGPLRQLLREIRGRKFEAVVTDRLYRYSRVVSRVQEIRKEATLANVRLFTVEPDQQLADPLNDILSRTRLLRDRQLPENVVPLRGRRRAAQPMPDIFPDDYWD